MCFSALLKRNGKTLQTVNYSNCEKSLWLPFPFNESNPDCGFFGAVNCRDIETPKIQLERGQIFYRLKNSYGGDNVRMKVN